MKKNSVNSVHIFLVLSSVLVLKAEDKPAEPLSAAELTRRKDALENWTFEPVSIEGRSFLLHFDRKDGSFFIQDRRTQVKWFSSWGRRGFASILLRGEGEKAASWLPVDRVEALYSEETKIRFRAASTQAPIPPVIFELESLSGSSGLSLRFEIPEESRARVAAVRLLESSLWVPDVDRGGVALPRGLGEWHDVEVEENFRVRLEGFPAPSRPSSPNESAEPSAEHFTLRFVGLLKSGNPLLLRWIEPATAVEVERRPVPGDSFPGRAAIFTSIELKGPAAKVEIYALGKEEIAPVDAAKAYRQLLGSSLHSSTLRSKTGAKPELRSFLGAALFRPAVGSSLSFQEVGGYAERLKRQLEIDEAAFILSQWSATVEAKAGFSFLPAAPEAGGSEGLKDLSKRLQEIGYIFGLEIQRDPPQRDESFAPLIELCSPQLILKKEEARSEAVGSKPEDLLRARTDLGRYASEKFGLFGLGGGSEAEVESCAYLEGPLGPFAKSPLSAVAWPLFPAAFGHCVRLATGPAEAIKPNEPLSFLAHLMLGEVPIYEIPPEVPRQAPPEDPRWCFARDEGWAAGKGLSAHDIFLKNTFEVLSYVARERFREPLLYHQKLTPDGSVRETRFGMDMRIVVNFGARNYEDKEDGFLIPPLGFVVRHPFLFAFHALRVHDVEYEKPAFFVVRSLEGKMYLRAERVNIYHGFGPEKIELGGKTFIVPRETVVRIW